MIYFHQLNGFPIKDRSYKVKKRMPKHPPLFAAYISVFSAEDKAGHQVDNKDKADRV